jgi:hypothetical protein
MLSAATMRNALALLVAISVVACSSKDSADDDADPTDTSYDPSSYCGTLQARLRECGVLGAGRFHCENFQDEAEVCETTCLAEAACSSVEGFYCAYSGAVPRCFEGCIGLSPFTCDDGVVLSAYTRCNTISECTNGEDELDCPATSTLKCRNVDERVQLSLFCDGQADCSDGSDETPGCAREHTCDGSAIQEIQICDGTQHCADGSDEAPDCAVTTCG